MRERSFIKQCFLLIWKRPFYAAVLLLTCVVLIWLNQLESNPRSITRVPVAVVDLAQDELSQTVWDALSEETLLQVVNQRDEQDKDALLGDLLWGRIEALYVIEADFSRQLQTGDYAGCMRVYYGVNQVSTRMLTERVSSAVLKICLRQRGMELLEEAYASVEEDFGDVLIQEAGEYLDGLEDASYPMEFVTLEGTDPGAFSFRSIVLNCLQLLLQGLALLVACGFLARQQEDGVFLRLRVLGHSPGKYLSLVFGLAALGLFIAALPAAIMSGTYDDIQVALVALGNFLFLLWLSFLLAFLMLVLRSKQIFLILIPVILLSLTLLAGVSVYFQGQSMVWDAVIFLNPFACRLFLPSRPYITVFLLVHMGILCAANGFTARIRKLI